MKVEYVNPFVTSAFNVLEAVLRQSPDRGPLSMLPSTHTSEQMNVCVGVTGDVQGIVIYGMSLVTADKVASTMIGQTIKTFDELAASAIAELCNMISGGASTLLSGAGYVCDITPPTLIRGAKCKISTFDIPTLVVPVIIEQGEIKVTVGLRHK
ncbi:MAG TPA: chemotaxis protein CheX [Capsulimonadaceae bacterium]|jgi:chemotaxis protein CheX